MLKTGWTLFCSCSQKHYEPAYPDGMFVVLSEADCCTALRMLGSGQHERAGSFG